MLGSAPNDGDGPLGDGPEYRGDRDGQFGAGRFAPSAEAEGDLLELGQLHTVIVDLAYGGIE